MRDIVKHLLRAVLPDRRVASLCERWRADPLSHPVLARMSVDELADLPIDPAEGR